MVIPVLDYVPELVLRLPPNYIADERENNS